MDIMHKMVKPFVICVFSLLADFVAGLWKERRADGTVLLEVLQEERNPEK